MLHLRWLGVVLGLLVASGRLQAGGNGPKDFAFFEAKIRPVLSTHCYECHSMQAKKLRAELLLDSKEGMLKGGISGPVFVLGKAKESLIIKALEHDGETKMPSKTKKLSKEIVADFVKWIDMGGPDPRTGGPALAKKSIDIEHGRTFWSFRPLGAAAPPAVKNTGWVRTPIDQFILARLEEKHLTPNQPISRERLIRRAYFDLLGLPPTATEVEAFVRDAAPDAYEKLLDRLLQSDHVGEHWARHWLDLVRFAESGGYEFDGDRPNAHHYRDFVIKAFNQDMPFDQFVRWQIAGDQLKPGDFLATSATGFLVAGPFPGQTTAKTQQLIRYNHLDDMISTLGSAMLGLSVGCARCHDHKYDPIPQENYYSLIAALSRTDSANLKINSDPDGYRQLKSTFDQAHAPLVKARDAWVQKELPRHLRDWSKANQDKPAPALLILGAGDARGKAMLQKQADGSLLAAGKAEKNDTYTIVGHTLQKGIKTLRIEALADKSLPKGGPGRGPDGSFLLTEVTLTAAPLDPSSKIKPMPVKLRAPKASAEVIPFPLAPFVENGKKTGLGSSTQIGKDHGAIYEIDGAVGFDGGTILTVTLKFDKESFAIGRPRIAFSVQSPAANLRSVAVMQHATELLTLAGSAQTDLRPEQREPATRWFRNFDPALDKLCRAVEVHAKLEPQPKLVDVFAATSGRGGDVHFLIRGEVEKQRELAKAGFVRVLMDRRHNNERWLEAKKPAAIDPRVALANWITDPNDGAGQLLARVIVNRLWQHHLGRGIVATTNDFGAQGDAPTHPELLDYLATELIKNGWKLKPIHKLIMLSAVYTQAGEISASNLKIEPQNRLWWRRPARRLEAEAIRDSLLVVAGTLDPAMYGPGPLDGNSLRRSIYLKVKRSQPIPLLQMFDVPEAIQSIGERSVTTVPTQSLAFMNSPFVRQAAQKFAQRIRPNAPEPVEVTLDRAYRTALGRHIQDSEKSRMQEFLSRQMESYGNTPQAREQAWVDCCQLLLCLNEFIFVD